MTNVKIEDRVSQALRHLRPEDISSVQRALVLLAEDPFASTLQTRRLHGEPDVFLLRASERLRVIYRIEGRQEKEGDPAAFAIVVEDIVSHEALKRHFSGGHDEAV